MANLIGASAGAGRPALAIFPWGDVIEDFLDPIGLDARAFAEDMTGGWLFGYVAALQEAGWRSVIVCASRHAAQPERLEHKATGAPIWLVPGATPSKSGWPSMLSLRRWAAMPLAAFADVLRTEACQAVLVQEYEDPRFDRLVRLGGRLGLPVYATFQGGDQTLSKLEGIVRASSLKRAAGLIIASGAERQRVNQSYAGALPPIVAIPNPLDCALWRPKDQAEARRTLGLDPDGFIAINHGRIDVKRKGLDILLRAWRHCGDAQLRLIGSGQDNSLLAELISDARLDNVHWQSQYSTDRDMMRTWLSAADIYVTASRVEGMPVAPLEAMACGLPVVATDAQGLPEILEQGEESGGIIIQQEDAGQLAEAVNRMRDPHLRARLAANALRRAEQGFSIDTVGRQLKALLG